MGVAMTYPNCPIDEVCVHIVVGFGKILKQCEYFKSEETEENAECEYDDYVIEG